MANIGYWWLGLLLRSSFRLVSGIWAAAANDIWRSNLSDLGLDPCLSSLWGHEAMRLMSLSLEPKESVGRNDCNVPMATASKKRSQGPYNRAAVCSCLSTDAAPWQRPLSLSAFESSERQKGSA